MKTLHCEIIKLFSYYFLIKTLKKKGGKGGKKEKPWYCLNTKYCLKSGNVVGRGGLDFWVFGKLNLFKIFEWVCVLIL